ncbi:unnamed protein product [Arctia plantaginis]|uniref:Uncharacterized protein n=1 Tax=Arctia plantaginis TaxID=874455 RepID=A0A8S0YSA9_ARCPL|nr:unnamed protein product [Arctia plantaginis]
MKSFMSIKIPVIIFFICLCGESRAKLNVSKANDHSGEVKFPRKINDGAALIFADEFKQTLDKYLFGICPQTYKSRWQMPPKGKNSTTVPCDLDVDQQELAGRLATLALRATIASRTECSRLGTALANTLGELARTANNRHALAAANNEQKKQRKLSKSQKMKIQAKQRTALAVKKKAAAVAAAAAAKVSA